MRTPHDETVSVETQQVTTIDITESTVEITTKTTEIVTEKTTIPVSNEPKVSALSLKSIQAKRELQQANQSIVRKEEQLPTEPFSETEMLEQWYKFAQKLVDNKRILMATNMQISEPVLNGATIVLELPNESVKEEFNASKNELLGYLRGHLHNHDITIEVIVNQSVENKFAFTAQDKYNRLNQINPTLEVLKKTFDLDI